MSSTELANTTPSAGQEFDSLNSSAHPALPAKLDQTLQSLTSNRSVLGYMVLSRGQPASIIGHSGVVFEGEHGRSYAQAIGRIVESVQIGLEEVSTDTSSGVRPLISGPHSLSIVGLCCF